MALLDGVLGNGGLLGGGGNSTSATQDSHQTSVQLATDPAFATSVSDLLHDTNMSSGSNGGDSSMNSNDFTGLGHASLAFQAPTFVGISSSSSQSDYNHDSSNGSHGGLLGGIL